MGPHRADLLIGAGGTAFGVVVTAALGDVGPIGITAAAVVGAALGMARSHPRAAWVVAVSVGLVVSALQEGNEGIGGLVVAHAFCAGRLEKRWAGIAAVAALVSAMELGVLLDGDSPVPAVLLPCAAWGTGRALRERELVARQLAERARELEEEREAHASLSVRYERARIASELHDIVAHAISVMVVQASAGQRLAATDPQGTAETFDAIAEAAREAEADMGRLVALLGDEGAIGPAPDLELIEELVARAASSGLAVTLRLEGEREGLPVAVVQIAYRVVQEALTNALRYASGAAVAVLVRGDRDGLVVEVRNDPAPDATVLSGSGTGNGLRGLRERVDACAGTLAAGPTKDGGWRVRARLPRRIAAATR